MGRLTMVRCGHALDVATCGVRVVQGRRGHGATLFISYLRMTRRDFLFRHVLSVNGFIRGRYAQVGHRDHYCTGTTLLTRKRRSQMLILRLYRTRDLRHFICLALSNYFHRLFDAQSMDSLVGCHVLWGLRIQILRCVAGFINRVYQLALGSVLAIGGGLSTTQVTRYRGRATRNYFTTTIVSRRHRGLSILCLTVRVLSCELSARVDRVSVLYFWRRSTLPSTTAVP